MQTEPHNNKERWIVRLSTIHNCGYKPDGGDDIWINISPTDKNDRQDSVAESWITNYGLGGGINPYHSLHYLKLFNWIPLWECVDNEKYIIIASL